MTQSILQFTDDFEKLISELEAAAFELGRIAAKERHQDPALVNKEVEVEKALRKLVMDLRAQNELMRTSLEAIAVMSNERSNWDLKRINDVAKQGLSRPEWPTREDKAE